jgi:hypothetical protein
MIALAVCFVAAGAKSADPAKFFKPPKASPPQLDLANIYPLGGQFPIGLYSILGNSKVAPYVSNMLRAAQNGFTFAGPYYGDNWRDFSPIYAAAQENLKFVFQIRPPAALAGVSIDDRPTALSQMSASEIAASVQEQVTAVLSDPIARNTVARWSLGAEEIRYWFKPELNFLKVTSQAIRAVENQFNVAHKPFTMYEPGVRDAGALKKTGKYQDMVSKGTYLTAYPRGPQRAGYAIWSYTQIVSAAKKLKTLPQAVLQLSQDFVDATTARDPAEIRRVVRHDAYLGLVMGIKSINIWSMMETRPNLTTHNEQFQAYASVAKDLTGELDLQKVFLFGEPRKDLKFEVTSGEAKFQYIDDSGHKFKYDTLHTFNAALGTDRYLFLVNSTEQPMNVSISGLPAAFLMDNLFAGTTTEVRQTSLPLQLDVLGVTALRFHALGTPSIAPASGLVLSNVPEPATSTLTLLVVCWAVAQRRRRK